MNHYAHGYLGFFPIQKQQDPLRGLGFIQMRENHSPLLQAAIRIGAAFKSANFGILRGLLTTSRISPCCSHPPVDSVRPRLMESGGFAPPCSWVVYKDQRYHFSLFAEYFKMVLLMMYMQPSAVPQTIRYLLFSGSPFCPSIRPRITGASVTQNSVVFVPGF